MKNPNAWALCVKLGIKESVRGHVDVAFENAGKDAYSQGVWVGSAMGAAMIAAIIILCLVTGIVRVA